MSDSEAYEIVTITDGGDRPGGKAETSPVLISVLEAPSESLTLDQYQDLARGTDRTAGTTPQSLEFPLLGLFGEAGSLLSELKKKQRDADSYVGYEASVVEELGDVLWYFSNLATRADIREGVSTWIFNHAAPLNFFENLNSVDYGLLKAVRELVAGYEAERCPLWLWEEAILKGYEMFRALRQHRRGVIIADLNHRTITFEKMPV